MNSKKPSKVHMLLQIELFGIVQGVCLRETIRKAASQLGLRGSVENRQNGSVLIILDGHRGDWEKLHRAILNTPGAHQIISIRVRELSDSRSFRDFHIL